MSTKKICAASLGSRTVRIIPPQTFCQPIFGDLRETQTSVNVSRPLKITGDVDFLTLDLPLCLVYGKGSTSSVPPTRNASMSITEQTLRIGDKVVYPNHGVGVIEQISSRTVGANVERYYLLKIKASSLKVMIPFSNAGNVGLRRVVKNGEVQKIIDFLSSGDAGSNADWKDRFKENSDKMRAGTLFETAVVLKSLLIFTTPSRSRSARRRCSIALATYL